jgi:hypothetical protein
MATATYFISCITYVTPGATAIAAISWRYFLVFACLTFVTILVLYFVYPETKGKSLEDLNAIFGDEVVVRLADATEEEMREMDREIKGQLGAEQIEDRQDA